MVMNPEGFYKCKINIENTENRGELVRFEFDSYPLVIVAVKFFLLTFYSQPQILKS
jgi:hypothetical protein